MVNFTDILVEHISTNNNYIGEIYQSMLVKFPINHIVSQITNILVMLDSDYRIQLIHIGLILPIKLVGYDKIIWLDVTN